MITAFGAPVQSLPLSQAMELSVLVDLEARWENLRVYQPDTAGSTSTTKELDQKQRAYEAFFSKLGIYNKTYKRAHIAELLLNNATRLGKWCWSMRDLVVQIQQDPKAHCPTHLLTKAYRWADRMADRTKRERITRPTPSTTIPTAIHELEELAKWCDSLTRIAS